MVIILYDDAPKLLLMAQPLKHPQSESATQTTFLLGVRQQLISFFVEK